MEVTRSCMYMSEVSSRVTIDGRFVASIPSRCWRKWQNYRSFGKTDEVSRIIVILSSNFFMVERLVRYTQLPGVTQKTSKVGRTYGYRHRGLLCHPMEQT